MTTRTNRETRAATGSWYATAHATGCSRRRPPGAGFTDGIGVPDEHPNATDEKIAA
jgi:hypothetical protein